MADINPQILITARDEASKVLKNVGDEAQNTGKAFEGGFANGLTRAGVVAGGVLATFGLLGKSAVESAASYEQSRIAFEAMLGSADNARSLLKEISDFAKETPFELPQVVEGSKRLLAYGISQDKVIDSFRTLGDIAANVGTEKLPQLVTAFGQVQAKGKLMGTELLQFTEAGVGLGGELQKMFNVSREELEKMISTGKIGFADVEKALSNMTSEGGLHFEGMVRQSKSFNGVMSNVRDTFGKFVRELVGINEQGDIREGSLFALLRDGASKFLVILNAIQPPLTAFVNAITGNLPIALGILGGLFGLLTIAIGAAAIAMWAFIAPALPIIGIALLIGAAIGVLVGLFLMHKDAIIGFANEVWVGIQTLWTNITTSITDIGNAIAAGFETILNLFTMLFSLNIPFIVAFAIGYLTTAIPGIVENVVVWFSSLPSRVNAIWEQFKAFIIARVNETWAWITSNISAWPGQIEAFIASIPSIVSGVFEAAKQEVLNKMAEMFEGVAGWWGQIGDIFNSIISKANEAISTVQRGFEAGAGAGAGSATGAIVPGPVDKPRWVLAHGGEEIVSRRPGRNNNGNGSGGNVTFNVTVGLFAGSEIEKRRIAEELYKALVTYAGTQNKSVSELLGG